MRKKGRLAVVLVVLVSLLSSCQMLAARAAMEFDLALEPAALSVKRGERAQVTVSVNYLVMVNIIPLPVEVTLQNPPEGVGAAGLSIAGDRGTLRISAGRGAEVGEHVILVEGTTGLVTKTTELRLTVVP